MYQQAMYLKQIIQQGFLNDINMTFTEMQFHAIIYNEFGGKCISK